MKEQENIQSVMKGQPGYGFILRNSRISYIFNLLFQLTDKPPLPVRYLRVEI